MPAVKTFVGADGKRKRLCYRCRKVHGRETVIDHISLADAVKYNLTNKSYWNCPTCQKEVKQLERIRQKEVARSRKEMRLLGAEAREEKMKIQNLSQEIIEDLSVSGVNVVGMLQKIDHEVSEIRRILRDILPEYRRTPVDYKNRILEVIRASGIDGISTTKITAKSCLTTDLRKRNKILSELEEEGFIRHETVKPWKGPPKTVYYPVGPLSKYAAA